MPSISTRLVEGMANDITIAEQRLESIIRRHAIVTSNGGNTDFQEDTDSLKKIMARTNSQAVLNFPINGHHECHICRKLWHRSQEKSL